MCSIFGAFGKPRAYDLERMRVLAGDRGRDGGRMEFYQTDDGLTAVLGNWRATPTPELLNAPLQPYWQLVHNGTIANDKELGGEPFEVDSMVLARYLSGHCPGAYSLAMRLANVKGSYALAMFNGDTILVATNYKPLYLYQNEDAVYFSSMERHLADLVKPCTAAKKLDPYTAYDLRRHQSFPLRMTFKRKALVIASGGLDSTVVAAQLCKEFGPENVTMLHFTYGCRAENREYAAVKNIAKALGCRSDHENLKLYGASCASTILGTGDVDRISKGIAGAEYAHEWVPARNLVLLAHAVAFAEMYGYGTIALGNNLEEAGAYPDNEEEFTELFSKLLPNAVQNGIKMEIVAPVGNLMKREIVALGVELGAPLELTWSCYRNGETHCGDCGPCFMRKMAFQRCGLTDPVMP